MKKFSLVSTVFNEINRLDDTIKDIEKQTLKPDEIIITDAGSTDGTYEKLKNWAKKSTLNIIILQEKGCNVARGRNLAIKKSKNQIIASTDFGCRFKTDWLEKLISPFYQHDDLQIVATNFSVIEEDLTTPAAKADYILSKSYKIKVDEYFTASSRSIAYYKNVWQKLNGYPEWLTLAADDTIFWRKAKKAGFKYLIVDEPLVFWLRHKTFMQYARENFRYGLGDGEAHINFRNFISHIIETTLRYSLFINIAVLPLTFNYFYWNLIVFLPQTFGLRSYFNAFSYWKKIKSDKYNFKIFMFALLLIELDRFFYIKGYLKGFLFSDKYKKQKAKQLQIFLKN